MRSSRLLSLLMILQRRGHAKAAELATELEVSVRTLYRDVAALLAAGVPIWTEPGPQGGIHLLDGWRTKLDGLTSPEAVALFLSGAPKALEDLGLEDAARGARAKVEATLPEGLRARAAATRERFLFDAPSWFTRAEAPPALSAVAQGVFEEHRLRFTYGEVERVREVSPLGLVLKAGTWYLVAQEREAVLTFRVDRMAAVSAAPGDCQRPSDFELGRHWQEATASFDASLLRWPCVLRLSPRAMRRLPQVVHSEAVRPMLEAAGPADARGFCVVSLRLESEEVAADQLLALGDGVEVLEPATLRERLRATALRMVELNSSRDTTRPGLDLAPAKDG